MNLRDARICLECEEVFEGAGAECPRCVRSTSVWLFRWLLPRVSQMDVPDLPHREQMLRYGKVA